VADRLRAEGADCRRRGKDRRAREESGELRTEQPDGDGPRVFFEHSGFGVSQPWGKQALRGAEVGWEKMFERLIGVVAGLAGRRDK
jgi:hypothetical protein